MKLNEVIAKYGNQEVDESKIKEVLGVKGNKVWKPINHPRFFSILHDGTIGNTIWNSSPYCKNAYEIGNCYETKEEAEFARDKRIFLTKFERYLRENEDEPVDLEDLEQPKYCIAFDYFKSLYPLKMNVRPQGTIFTSNLKALTSFILYNEKDIKKYMFGVE